MSDGKSKKQVYRVVLYQNDTRVDYYCSPPCETSPFLGTTRDKLFFQALHSRKNRGRGDAPRGKKNAQMRAAGDGQENAALLRNAKASQCVPAALLFYRRCASYVRQGANGRRIEIRLV